MTCICNYTRIEERKNKPPLLKRSAAWLPASEEASHPAAWRHDPAAWRLLPVVEGPALAFIAPFPWFSKADACTARAVYSFAFCLLPFATLLHGGIPPLGTRTGCQAEGLWGRATRGGLHPAQQAPRLHAQV